MYIKPLHLFATALFSHISREHFFKFRAARAFAAAAPSPDDLGKHFTRPHYRGLINSTVV